MTNYTNAETEQSQDPEERPLSVPVFRHVARMVLGTFILTFISSRVMVILIMTHRMPAYLFFHMGKTHVHHLNYGIFILSAVGAYLIFRRPSGRKLTYATIAYGIGLGLTFDEFGMWVHLGGGYWQRASFDAVVIISAALGLMAYMPSPKRFHTKHWVLATLVGMTVLASIVALGFSVTKYGRRLAPWLQQIEADGPQ